MTRTDLLNEIERLYSDIDKCTTALVKARAKKDEKAVADAQFLMETLIVAAQQDLSVIYNFVKDREHGKL